jgi:hypothetical protein
MDGVDEPCSPTPPTGHQHQSGHLMCYEGRTSSRAIDTFPVASENRVMDDRNFMSSGEPKIA